MTKKKLEERRNALQVEFNRLRAHSEALNGAIQDCNYWLAELEKPVDAVAETKD